MTEVLIKAVTPFAEYDGLIYSYKVTCILYNGRELILVDEKPFDLTEAVDKKVVVTIATSFINENKECADLFEGEIKYSDLTNEYLFVSECLTSPWLVISDQPFLAYSSALVGTSPNRLSWYVA